MLVTSALAPILLGSANAAAEAAEQPQYKLSIYIEQLFPEMDKKDKLPCGFLSGSLGA